MFRTTSRGPIASQKSCKEQTIGEPGHRSEAVSLPGRKDRIHTDLKVRGNLHVPNPARSPVLLEGVRIEHDDTGQLEQNSILEGTYSLNKEL